MHVLFQKQRHYIKYELEPEKNSLSLNLLCLFARALPNRNPVWLVVTVSVSSSSQDAFCPIPSAFMSTYNKEYTGTFGPPAPDARYKLTSCYKQTFSCLLYSHPVRVQAVLFFFGARFAQKPTDPSEIARKEQCYRACLARYTRFSLSLKCSQIILYCRNRTVIRSYSWLS